MVKIINLLYYVYKIGFHINNPKRIKVMLVLISSKSASQLYTEVLNLTLASKHAKPISF